MNKVLIKNNQGTKKEHINTKKELYQPIKGTA